MGSGNRNLRGASPFELFTKYNGTMFLILYSLHRYTFELQFDHGEFELSICIESRFAMSTSGWDPSGMWGSSKGSGPTFLDGLLIAWSLFA